ncbi:MAG: undecaprenyl-diphosphate phosphatase, partial [Candidatus Hydrogenedentota bacterium]
MSEDTSISLAESVILGFLQGITEFLPISSSGHLVILQGLFGMTEPHLLFDVMLHVGTLAAILVVFRKDICELARAAAGIAASRGPSNQPGEWMLVAVAVGCIPTALIGMALSEQFERMFASMTAAGIGLLVTGFILMSTVWGNSQKVNVRAH